MNESQRPHGLSKRMTLFVLKTVLTETRQLLVESEAEVRRLTERVAQLEAERDVDNMAQALANMRLRRRSL